MRLFATDITTSTGLAGALKNGPPPGADLLFTD
jgi:hypothetical protein